MRIVQSFKRRLSEPRKEAAHNVSTGNRPVAFFSVQSAADEATCPRCGHPARLQLTLLDHAPPSGLVHLSGPHTYPICDCMADRLSDALAVAAGKRTQWDARFGGAEEAK